MFKAMLVEKDRIWESLLFGVSDVRFLSFQIPFHGDSPLVTHRWWGHFKWFHMLNCIALMPMSLPWFFDPLLSVESVALLWNILVPCFALLGDILLQQCFVSSSSVLPQSWAPSGPSKEPANILLVSTKCHFYHLMIEVALSQITKPPNFW